MGGAQGLIFGVIAFEFFTYLVVRQFVNVIEYFSTCTSHFQPVYLVYSPMY